MFASVTLTCGRSRIEVPDVTTSVSASRQRFEFANCVGYRNVGFDGSMRLRSFFTLKTIEESRMVFVKGDLLENATCSSETKDRNLEEDFNVDYGYLSGEDQHSMSQNRKSINIVWQECLVGKQERQKLLGQKGCVVWITGLSGSGKSTLACTLSRELHSRGKLSYVLDGDNVRHGLNGDLGFGAEERVENIRRIGEVAKLFADAGVICIASLISPYRRDRDACRALLPDGDFIEIFMDVPLEVCEERDPKGLYKLARVGKIKDFTGIDDPYEAPLNCEIMIQQKDGVCASPTDMAKQVVSYLEEKGFLHCI